MKGLKKILSAAIAAATLLAGTTFTASADYDPYDVNRDGRVSPADLVQLNKYLWGAYSYTNYNLCDVNQNLVADAADAECLKLRVLGNDYSSAYYSRKTENVVSMPSNFSWVTLSQSSSNSEGRSYLRRRYDNNGNPTGMSVYTLTPNKMTLPESSNPVAEPRLVIGDDDRIKSKKEENSGIVFLQFSNDYIEGTATGFVVGDHEIATAAHCVYDKEENTGWYSMSIKTYNSNGNIINNNLHPVEVHFPRSYTSSEDMMYDYALITVKEDLSDRVHFSLGTPYYAPTYSNIPIYVAGSPSDMAGLYYAEGNILNKSFIDQTDVFYYDVDVSEGQSGGPVYTITKIGDECVYTAVAINVGESAYYNLNFGSMITDYSLQFYLNNPNASYSSN